jgi:uncharacterized protein
VSASLLRMAKDDEQPKIRRRAFLGAGIGASATLALGGCNTGDASGPTNESKEIPVPPWERPPPPVPPGATPPAERVADPIPMRKFGSTNLNVTMLGLGTWLGGIQEGTREGAIEIVQTAVDEGVNYIDTAPTYAPAEERIGEALVGRRHKVVLATKTDLRTYDGAMSQLDNSLKLLRTDWIDVWQIHAISAQGEIDSVFAKGGALEAVIKARDEKKVRFIGITGHYNAALLLQMIERFPFDTLLTAINIGDWQRHPALDKLIPAAIEKKMAIIGMKTLGGPHTPALQVMPAKQALSWVWSIPGVSTTIVGASSIKHVMDNAAHARSFVPYTTAKHLELARALTVDQAAGITWFKEA